MKSPNYNTAYPVEQVSAQVANSTGVLGKNMFFATSTMIAKTILKVSGNVI